MRAIRIGEILCLILLAGCGSVKPPVAEAPPATPAATQAAPSVAAPESTPPAPPSQTAPAPLPGTAPPPPAATVPPPSPTAPGVAQPPPKVTAPSATAPARPPPAPPPAVAKPAAPPLDLESLKQRLKDTKAIGVLTKLTLKNQVDDLLDQFRAYYQGKLKTTLADLRRSYDLLVLKVLSLLQDSDPPLATAIVTSREPIWGILSDPKKFATI